MEQISVFWEELSNLPYSGYCETSAVHYGLMCTLAIASLCFVLNKLTGEYSWVDRLWPLLPIFHGANYLYHQQQCTSHPISTRQIVMLLMFTAWGLRLTYNFARKGGFTKGG
jgi:steroid 5-alpha reductase family enzyme